MELLLRDEKGKLIQIEQIGELGAGDIVIKMPIYMKKMTLKIMKKNCQKNLIEK